MGDRATDSQFCGGNHRGDSCAIGADQAAIERSLQRPLPKLRLQPSGAAGREGVQDSSLAMIACLFPTHFMKRKRGCRAAPPALKAGITRGKCYPSADNKLLPIILNCSGDNRELTSITVPRYLPS